MSIIRKIKSGVVFALIATLFVFAIPFGEVANASSGTDTVESEIIKALNSITEEEFNAVTDAIEQGIVVENGVYAFDNNAVENSNLTEVQINNLDSFINNYLSQEEVKEMDNEISNSDVLKENFSQARIPIAALLVAATAVAVFVGANIAAAIIADLYKLSAISFCRSWQKYAKIKQACKDLGYL